jgi:hypothetical protein
MPTPKWSKWSQIVNDFWDLWNFPNCIGAIDGKHVKVQASTNSGSKFFKHKHTCLAPHVIVGDEAFPLKTYFLRPYSGSQTKGTMRKVSSIIGFPETREWWKIHLEY